VTPLAAAAFNGNDRLVRTLLEHGADPRAQDATGKGPLAYAAARGQLAVIRRLLDAGVPVDERFGNGLTALMWAAGHANDVPEAEGLAAVRLLLERGAAVDLADARGRTALLIAAERGHGALLELLVRAGADAGRRDASGLGLAELAAEPSLAARAAAAQSEPR
jgi:ankyrin repeat protein